MYINISINVPLCFQLTEAGPNGLHGHHAADLAVVDPHTDTGLAPTQNHTMVEMTVTVQTLSMRTATLTTATAAQDHTYSDQSFAQEHARISGNRPSVSRLMTVTTSAGK